eukprot:scaffold248529_cov33-Tisochrysis_lutea.AAC.2
MEGRAPHLKEVVIVILARLLRIPLLLGSGVGEVLVAQFPEKPLLLLQVRQSFEGTIDLTESSVSLRRRERGGHEAND